MSERVDKSGEEYQKKKLSEIIQNRLNKPFEDMVEEKAHQMGFSSAAEYKEFLDKKYIEANTVRGVLVHAVTQADVLGSFEYVLKEPGAKPVGMDDPVDFVLADYMEFKRAYDRNGVSLPIFSGFVSVKNIVGGEFPTPSYELNYGVVVDVLGKYGWKKGPAGWSKAEGS